MRVPPNCPHASQLQKHALTLRDADPDTVALPLHEPRALRVQFHFEGIQEILLLDRCSLPAHVWHKAARLEESQTDIEDHAARQLPQFSRRPNKHTDLALLPDKQVRFVKSAGEPPRQTRFLRMPN